ncbi:twin-arginine translocase subunit TatC [Psychrosphaera aestuarii]|uniref:twin-arginine translocase subunit TatC n=1 Tax=Psychrosphaera aestuarii TaxID=1266052 RepID=UPI001B32F623|nr:twin-arginine translocase subunit TatC [Psychrosphaera aestuarii]
MTTPSSPLIEHLIEIRQRLIRSVLAVLICFLGLAYFANDIYTQVSQPLLDVLPDGASMIATDVAAPFFTPFKMAFMFSIMLAFPIILHQMWGFIAPGLYSHEKKLAGPILFSSVFLFYGGIAFAYFIVFPIVFAFFTSVAPEGITIATDISSYLDFILKLFFAFGLAFEVPIVVFVSCWAGVTTVAKLKEKRPFVVVGAFILGMLLTPPDVISQTLLAIPMWLLFELGLFLATLVKPRK